MDGPTKCDEDRAKREQEIDKVWTIVQQQPEPGKLHHSAHGIFTDAPFVLREAMNCYQNGASLAVCITARGCVEAMLDAATQQRPIDQISTEEIRQDPAKIQKDILVNSAIEDGLITQADIEATSTDS